MKDGLIMDNSALRDLTQEIPAQSPATQADGAEPKVRPALGLILPTIVLAVFWIITEASFRVESGMFYRFVARMITLLVLLLFFLAWGWTRRHFTWTQRLIAFVMIVGSMAISGAAGHPATGLFATAMIGLPIVISLSVGWLWLTRRRAPQLELAGIGIITVAVFGVVALLRWDGLDGRQRAELSWRWTPSPEERFLTQRPNVSSAPTENQMVILKELPDDWTSFRGGEHESTVRQIQLGDWTKAPPREIWRRRIGPGWSSVIAVGDFLFTQEQRGDKEAVVCYQATTGNEVWSQSNSDRSERFDDSLSGTGPRATPTFHENRIYAYGAKGRLVCLNAATGAVHWSHLLFEMTGAALPQWGASTSPTVIDGLVAVFVGGKNDQGLLAFDLVSGEQRWSAPAGTVSYSTPQVLTIAGTRQIVMHDEVGLNGYQIRDGKRLWHHPSPNATSFQPMLQSHQIDDDRLIVNWDSGLLCCQIRPSDAGWNVTPLWTSNRLKPSFNDFVVYDGHLYGLDDGILCCVDLAKGQRRWKRGRYGFGQLLLLPDQNELLVLTEAGEVVRVATDPNEHREMGTFTAIRGKTWNHPMLAHGRLVVRNSEEMACFELTEMPRTALTD